MTKDEINRRLAYLFDRGAALQRQLAEMALKAIAENWTHEQHEAARREPLEEMLAHKQEIHRLVDESKAMKDRDGTE
jgi:hypothetical protein